MAIKSYIFTADYKAPYSVATGRPDRPQDIRMRQFHAGEIVKGELKHANNKPAFVLVNGVMPIDLSVVKELVTKEISHSSADGNSYNPDLLEQAAASKSKMKFGYVDGILIGGVLGFGLMFLAEKQGWINSEGHKNKLYAAGAGAALGAYIVYRMRMNSSYPKLKN